MPRKLKRREFLQAALVAPLVAPLAALVTPAEVISPVATALAPRTLNVFDELLREYYLPGGMVPQVYSQTLWLERVERVSDPEDCMVLAG